MYDRKPVCRQEIEFAHNKALSIHEAQELAEQQSEDGTIPLSVFSRHSVRLGVLHSEPPRLCSFDSFTNIQRKIVKIAMVDEREDETDPSVPFNFIKLQSTCHDVEACPKQNFGVSLRCVLTVGRRRRCLSGQSISR